jgi:3',5'-cyclic AMP phosphodiesterase CpdA
MSATQEADAGQQRIIIHHLSDLHFRQQSDSSRTSSQGHDPLVKYRGYLEGLPPERRPDLIVITGDLTATGHPNDLSTIATILRNHFPKWDKDLAHHVFVVPGPRDVSWQESGKPGLEAFYKAFHDFAVPSQQHGLPDHGLTPTKDLNWIAYPLDTCYALDEFRADLRREFKQHAKTYHTFVQRYRRARRRFAWLFAISKDKKRARVKELRQRYLRLTEGNQLTPLDAGRIAAADLTTFTNWINSLRKAAKPADAAKPAQEQVEPLKIVITHHPLAVPPEPEAGTGPALSVHQRFREVMNQARDAGFHLALHGHIHKPQVLSDLSIVEGPDTQHPLRQIGAGSLGDDGMFNEITAVYSTEQDQRQWRLEIRTVNVLAERPHDASSLVLLNPTEATAAEMERLKRDARTNSEFDARVRLVTRQFSETIYRSQAMPIANPLPQAAMQGVEGIIRDIVFKDFAVRVRLLLKDNESGRANTKLKATYLTPAVSDGTGPLTYPASIAAWSLVLGRTLAYPRIIAENVTEEDQDWLKRSEKVPELLKVLETLQQQAGTRSYPAHEMALRYEMLHSKLSALRDAGKTDLHGNDIYQQPPTNTAPMPYPYFICVPFPLRPSTGGFRPDLPEIAVLDVGVRVPERPTDQRDESRDKAPVEVFTLERVRMLESLTELIGVILMTSSALGKPKGIWEDRFRVGS